MEYEENGKYADLGDTVSSEDALVNHEEVEIEENKESEE